jgi:hypothetical protein
MNELLSRTPSELAELRLELADAYSKAGELKVQLMRLHALYYEAYRQDHKSDTGLERAWELTDDGLNLMEINVKLKTIQTKMSAIKTLLETKSMESRNFY